jgi:RNA 2',3'-cyclic 3'-phosphodiesterase
MRAFIAIELPEELRNRLAQEQARFHDAAADGRWTRPEGIHLTLKFLGEIPDQQVEQVKKALGEIGGFEPFRIHLKGFGFFPDALRPRVFYAGIDAPPQLAQLAAQVETALAPLGFPPDQRTFSPHLTLVRFKVHRQQPKLQGLLAAQGETSMGELEVSDFFLWESKLSSQGAQYRKVARFP